MIKSSFEFEILVHGSSAKEYYHKGKNYIEGKKGSHFSLRMKNNSNGKALFIPTVDGLSIISGKEGSFKSQGYIVNAYDSVTIDGWRTSDEKVSQFYFSTPEKSYATKVNKGGNLGVIGCAVYKEKERIEVTQKVIHEYIFPVPDPKPYQFPNNGPWYSYTCSGLGSSDVQSLNTMTCASALSADGTSGQTRSAQALGTGFGEDKYSPITKVDFERADKVAEVFSIYYNTKEKLEELGVEFKKPVYVAPSAFPNEDGYCERP
jgi:hypothetical protein